MGLGMMQPTSVDVRQAHETFRIKPTQHAAAPPGRDEHPGPPHSPHSLEQQTAALSTEAMIPTEQKDPLLGGLVSVSMKDLSLCWARLHRMRLISLVPEVKIVFNADGASCEVAGMRQETSVSCRHGWPDCRMAGGQQLDRPPGRPEQLAAPHRPHSGPQHTEASPSMMPAAHTGVELFTTSS